MAALNQLARRLQAEQIGVVGVQTIRHPGLSCGDAITLTADGARRFAHCLGVDGDTADGATLVRRACDLHGLDDLTVAVEYGNVRIGEVAAADTVVLLAALAPRCR